MKPVKYHRHAKDEMVSSALYYEERNDGLGERFLKAVEAAEAAIARRPLSGSLFAAGTRRIRVKKFPFVLIYKEYPDFIKIFAVAHGSRKPGFWAERLK